MFDVETQKNFRPGYSLITRAVTYCARMISDQINTEFTTENYDGLKKVYSIWICFNPPKYIGNTITKFYLTQENIIGDIYCDRSEYDKLEIIMISLDEELDQRDNELIKMLNTLFSSKKSKEDIESSLRNDFGINLDSSERKEFDQMCNLSGMIKERGIQEGIKQGLTEGVKKEKIRTVKRLINLDYSDDVIVDVTGVSIDVVMEIRNQIEKDGNDDASSIMKLF